MQIYWIVYDFFSVTAEKEGYILTGPNSKGEFNAHKLAEVIVTVKDKSNGMPLQVRCPKFLPVVLPYQLLRQAPMVK